MRAYYVKVFRHLLSTTVLPRPSSPASSVGISSVPGCPVGWFQQHPYLQSDKPEPVTVGGVKGERFDVVVGDLPTDYDRADLFESSYGDSWAVEEGVKNRITVLEDVKGETVVIFFGAPAAEFDEFWPKAETVLKTVEWKGA